MHIHILGICGTFMGGVAVLAREAGHRVTGCDANVYPPMSDQLAAQGIELVEGWDPGQIALVPDMFVIGNVVSRGNPLVEEILARGLPYVSGPQWLAENVLRGRWVLAVAGTHGKTTTASMLAWMLQHAGLEPGFLIGGIPENFGVSARLPGRVPATARAAGRPGESGSHDTSPFFVIEADEYDTAFFDKRSKFVHYGPRTVVLNNLEFDHADIFPDLASIEAQFHQLVRIVPGNGLLVVNGGDANLARVLAQGGWTPVERFGVADGWSIGSPATADTFEALWRGASQGRARWHLVGDHNRFNALAALAAARHAGVPPAVAIESLESFSNVKRRMEVRGSAAGITVYDDFAHHPTAIAATLAGLRARVGTARIIAVLEPRSNTMKRGVLKAALADSLAPADRVYCYAAGLEWNAAAALAPLGAKAVVCDDFVDLLTQIAAAARSGDHVLIMSNGGFGGIHEKLLADLRSR